MKSIKSFKVMLLPNNKQKTKLFQYANTARFAYNWAIAMEKENYEQGKDFIYDNELRKVFTQLKKQPEYQWLNSVSNNVPKQAIKDACNAYKRFFNGQCKYPRFKSKKRTTPGFYQDSVSIQFTNDRVKVEGFASSKKRNKQKLNWIKIAEKGRIPIGCKYTNPRITFDGLNWWVSIGIEVDDCNKLPLNEGLGIDLGIIDLAICSDGKTYKNINKASKVKKLKKKKHRLQRKVSRKYIKNMKGESYCKTRNIIKNEKQLLKVNRRLTNIHHNHLHQTTSEIVNRKPMFIVLEDLNVNGMMKNKYLSKAIQEQCLYEFYRQIQYKTSWNNIKFIKADRYFPSSKLCSVCGSIKKELKLSDRIYICECGNEIDRDYQASLNLKAYGETVMQLAS